MPKRILLTRIESEGGVVVARQRARQVSALLGFEAHDQTRIATAVSEIARNALVHGGGGSAEFSVDLGPSRSDFVIRISDAGPGIADVATGLDDAAVIAPESGGGIRGARRLMDGFVVRSRPGGTVVEMRKLLPRRSADLSPAQLAEMSRALSLPVGDDPFEEIRQQNGELLRSLEELRERQEELTRLNAELEETNRGVLALYAELEDKAEHLRRAHEVKTRFVSHMGHEFRTPVNAILALSRILLDRMDGPLGEEQERQIRFIRKAAEDVAEMVDDFMDLARLEAGKSPVRLQEFSVADLFGTLRGLMRPLLTDSITLGFEDASGLPPLFSDEGKVAQVLRNFLSNAIKFTERGRVTVSVERLPDDQMRFCVEDTGIGIAPEEQQRIFEEFVQLDSAPQKRAKGSGLGLSVSKKLAELLGGSVAVTSTLGVGSIFCLTVPRRHPDAPPVIASTPDVEPAGDTVVLVIDDDPTARYVLRQLTPPGCRCIEADSGRAGLQSARAEHPDVIFLDLTMPETSGVEVLEQLRGDPVCRDIPVVVYTSQQIGASERERLQRAPVLLKANATREVVSAMIHDALTGKEAGR